jgi:F-type H+-transporting ATPase subunit epsilon
MFIMAKPKLMSLKVLLPFEVFADESEVERIVLETSQGSYGLLPKRLDCVAAIVPGIITYQRAEGGERYIAVDAGVLVKTGTEVSISVRHAIAGKDLAQLRTSVEAAFNQQSAEEKKVQWVFQKMESDFIHRLVSFQKGG